MEITFERNGRKVDIPDILNEWAHSFASEMIDAGELLYLAAAIASYDWPVGSFLAEIGAYQGRTTAFMAHVLRLLGHDVPVLSIDPFERVAPTPLNPQGSYPDYLSMVSLHQIAERCLPLMSFSRDAALVVAPKIGVLVIDGGHDYADVSADIALYAPKVLPGGLIFLDDYGPSYPGVIQAVDEYFASRNPFILEHKSHFAIARRPLRPKPVKAGNSKKPRRRG
jgi:hypothetical protein